mmetsp:Transcript_85117/g.155974  ORF Transcript_85117/g.155974 Transcript_85117/m.155974 type:complete len:251 (+) Transcript_85117:91-843(+)
MSNLLHALVILALSFICVLGNEERSKRITARTGWAAPVLIGMVAAACSGSCCALYCCYRRRTCCFKVTSYGQTAAIGQVVGQPVEAAVVQGKPALSVHSTQVRVHDDSTDASDPKLAARRDREGIPPGMALVEIKDRTQGDTAEEMVLELYKGLQNGVERAGRMQTNLSPDGRTILVPESDVQELYQAWQMNFKEARRRVEAKLNRRATRLLFFVRGDNGVAVKVEFPSSSDDSQSTVASSSSSHGGDCA